MDQLELLKKQWQTQEQELPHLSYNDIYKMVLRKSSSIVKWIFYISIAEILFWTILAFCVPESSAKFSDDIGLHNTLLVANILNYLVFGFFIFLFYKNYLRISTTDSIKDLMKNILRTRKTVRYFVIYNVLTFVILLIVVNAFYYLNQDEIFRYMTEDYGVKKISQEKFINIFFLIQIVVGVVMVAVVLLFYRLLYGILLRRLYRNYKELKKIEL
ncbi:MAG: hypothetical protein ACTIJ9_14535 [Aequorivita sp.]